MYIICGWIHYLWYDSYLNKNWLLFWNVIFKIALSTRNYKEYVLWQTKKIFIIRMLLHACADRCNFLWVIFWNWLDLSFYENYINIVCSIPINVIKFLNILLWIKTNDDLNNLNFVINFLFITKLYILYFLFKNILFPMCTYYVCVSESERTTIFEKYTISFWMLFDKVTYYYSDINKSIVTISLVPASCIQKTNHFANLIRW